MPIATLLKQQLDDIESQIEKELERGHSIEFLLRQRFYLLANTSGSTSGSNTVPGGGSLSGSGSYESAQDFTTPEGIESISIENIGEVDGLIISYDSINTPTELWLGPTGTYSRSTGNPNGLTRFDLRPSGTTFQITIGGV